jgi:hypothetical protein
MTEDITQRAREALEGVSAGPWRWEPSKYIGSGYVITASNHTAVHAAEWGGEQGEQFNHADASFAATARTLVPELIAEVERLRTDLETCQRLLRNPETVALLHAADENSAVELNPEAEEGLA